jgi:hypothetical protein
MSESEKVRENRLRRMAERQGLRLEKSRRRDVRAINYGTYWLVYADRNGVAFGDTNNGYGMSLDEIEAYLTSDDRE